MENPEPHFTEHVLQEQEVLFVVLIYNQRYGPSDYRNLNFSCCLHSSLAIQLFLDTKKETVARSISSINQGGLF